MADNTYSNVAVASGDAAQAAITRDTDIENIVIQATYADIDDEVQVVMQQSQDNVSWDALLDDKGQVFRVECLKQGAKPKSSGSVVRTLAGVFAKYLRAKLMVKNATVGTVTILVTA